MTETEVKIDREGYASILNMLGSPDKESVILGLSILEKMDKVPGMTFILMLKKRAKCSQDDWNTHASGTMAWMKSIGADPDTVLSFRNILETITKQQADSTQMRFFMDEFATHLKEQIREMGYPFVDKLEITLKFKDDGGQENLTGQSL